MKVINFSQVNWWEGVPKSWQSIKIKVTKAVIVGVYMVKFVGSGRSSVSMTECNVVIDVEV